MAPYSGGCTFIDDCLSGRLYSRLREAINDGSAGRLGWWTLEEVKTGVLACIYGEARFIRDSKVGRAIFALYPEFAERMVNLAFHMEEIGGQGYFPCLMQRIESDVMIHGVAKALMDTGIDEKPTSIHDAFLIRQEDATAVEEVIRKQWRMRLGVEPGIKTTVCR